MKILLIYVDYADRTSGAYHRGLAAISGALRDAGHERSLIHLTSPPDDATFKSSVKSHSADLIGFTSMTNMYPEVLRYAQLCKEVSNAPLICGGIHPTLAPEQAMADGVFDYLCIGEGEAAIADLCKAMQRGEDTTRIAGIWARVDGEVHRNPVRSWVSDLDKLPREDRELLGPIHGNDRHGIHFLVSRGCPYNCSYCCNESLRGIIPGKYVRFRSVDSVIAELKEIRKRNPTRHIHFMDDILTLNKEWMREFADRYKREIDIKYTCCSRVDLLDEEMVKLLRESGCREVKMGIESGNEAIREKVLNRKMANKQIVEAFRLLKKYRIRGFTFNMVGLPFEDWRALLDTIKLNARIRPWFAAASIFYPFPQSELYQVCKEHGFLTERQVKGFYADDTILDQPTISRATVQFVYRNFQSLVKLFSVYYAAADMVRPGKTR